jgi:hypothetical protein
MALVDSLRVTRRGVEVEAHSESVTRAYLMLCMTKTD